MLADAFDARPATEALLADSGEALADIAGLPLWQRLPAVVAGRVVTLDRLGYPGIPGRRRLVDDLTTLLTS